MDITMPKKYHTTSVTFKTYFVMVSLLLISIVFDSKLIMHIRIQPHGSILTCALMPLNYHMAVYDHMAVNGHVSGSKYLLSPANSELHDRIGKNRGISIYTV